MANITIRNTSTALTWNLAQKMTNQGVTRTTQSYTRNSRPIIYCNYPETLGADDTAPCAENNKIVFQKQVTAGETNIFFSHRNHVSGRYYGIQIYNPNTGSVTVKKLKYGYAAGWDASTAAKNYLADTTEESKTILSNQVWWVKQISIPTDPTNNGVFAGHLLISATQSVIVTVYLYKSLSNIDGYETIYAYPSTIYNNAVYSGSGTGYILSKSISLSIDASSTAATNLAKKNYHFVTGEPAHVNTSEITSLTLQNGSIAKVNASSPLNNLGNWGTQYKFTVTISNNTSASKTVYGFLGAPSARVALQSTNTAGQSLESNKTWQFLQESIPANSSKTFDYTYMLGSHGASACNHVFSLSSTAETPV